MILNISERKLTVIENGIYHFELSGYPNITKLELNKIITFMKYEKSYGRQIEIICKDANVISAINDAILDMSESFLPVAENNFVYHATNFNAAQKILSEGKLLSAVKVHNKTGKELSFEKRQSLWNDPADYFEHIMFCWGENPTGDYVVLSEDLPKEDDLVNGNFNAGIRFYFLYEKIIRHPKHAFDGYHSIKIKDEIMLADYLHSCIIPEQYKNGLANRIPSNLLSKVHYLSQDRLGISSWNEKVYGFVNNL